jgi:hypothetical protein
MKTKLTRQEVLDINYAAAVAADDATTLARESIWTATGNYIEYDDTTTALEIAEANLRKALEEVGKIKAAIMAGTE